MSIVQNYLVDGLCDCEHRDQYKLYSYIDRNNNLIGTYCSKCGIETLVQEFDVDTYPRNQPVLRENTAFQVQCTKTKIDQSQLAQILKPGDHIAWRRALGYWHHAIVSEVNAEENTIKRIHWMKMKNNNRTRYKIVLDDMSDENGPTYRIDYPESVTNENPTELVLARADSRIGDTDYHLSSDNCESFATFCKCGVNKSHQIFWLKRKFDEVLCASIVVGIKSVVKGTLQYLLSSGGMIKRAGQLCNRVGAGIVVILDGHLVIFDLYKIYRERLDANITKIAFIEESIHRIVQSCVCSAATPILSVSLEHLLALGGSFVGGPGGLVIGGIIGGIVGGFVGNAFGKGFGTVAGSFLGHSISGLIKVNDRAVVSIDDLHPGDHIVMCGWLLHPRCHAIVVEHNDTYILVIRNTKTNGVVKEYLPFRKPLFRVEYSPDKCYDTKKVIENAMTRLGERRYNLIRYNCKTFARQCKSEFVPE